MVNRVTNVPTAADVARLAGVSKATVSYVLSGRRSGDSRVSEETRQRVLDAVRTLGYAPNQSARALGRGRTERVCLVLPRLGAPYFELLARDLQDAIAPQGYAMVIAMGGDGGKRPVVLDQLRRRLADGVVLAEGVHLDPAELAELVALNVAVVAMTDEPVPAGVDVVRSNASDACRGAVEHLASAGHQRIAFIGHFPPARGATAGTTTTAPGCEPAASASTGSSWSAERRRAVRRTATRRSCFPNPTVRLPFSRRRTSRPSARSGRPETPACGYPTSSPSSASATSPRTWS